MLIILPPLPTSFSRLAVYQYGALTAAAINNLQHEIMDSYINSARKALNYSVPYGCIRFVIFNRSKCHAATAVSALSTSWHEGIFLYFHLSPVL